jgi:NAD(P)-dependent dehydrogenase (short-subunit alcohol dehydrogenase family)
MSRLDGRTAIVTGAGQGIGRGIALALAKEGAAVALVGRTAAKVEAVAAEVTEFGGRALALHCDVTDREAVFATVATAAETWGRLDVLVNNAQTTVTNRPVEEATPEDALLCWSSGPMATLHCMQAAFPHLRERGGAVVNFGSNTAIEGAKGFGAYAMAKEGIRGLSRVAAREWGPFGIRVNVVCPFAGSPKAASFNEDHPKAAAAILRNTPLGRMGDCETDIGRAVVALVSDDMDYVTGATLMVDGGLTFLH